LGADYFDRLDTQRVQGYHVRRLEQLGSTVTLSPQAGESEAGERSLHLAEGFAEESHQHLLPGCQMKYQFIAQHGQQYPISTMCRVLEVAVSGFYAWLHRVPSQRSQQNTGLEERIAPEPLTANTQKSGSRSFFLTLARECS
jgi:hypothetical protein